MPVISCVPAADPLVTQRPSWPAVSTPPNSAWLPKTVMSVGSTPVDAAPLMPVISWVPGPVPSVTHSPPTSPAVLSTPLKSTSAPKTVRSDGFNPTFVPVPAPTMPVSSTVPAAVASVVHKPYLPLAFRPLNRT